MAVRPGAGGTSITGGLRADGERHHDVNIDGAAPLPANEWLEQVVARMKGEPNPPQTITEASRRIEIEMAGAFARRQVDEGATARGIELKLRGMNWFKKATRRPL
jgi:hypothetical protein